MLEDLKQDIGKDRAIQMKVLFMTNIPSPYRVSFFEELSQYCELTVLYESDRAADRDGAWLSTKTPSSYKSIYLKSLIRLSSSAFCPEIISYLDTNRFDLIIVGVYSTPTGMYAIHYMKKKRIPYVISCDGGIPGSVTGLKAALKRYFLSGAEGYLSTGIISDQYLQTYGAVKERLYRYPFTSIRMKDLSEKPTSPEERQKIRRLLGLPEDELLVLSVGQFISRKGYDLLIKAAGTLKKTYGREIASFCIVGGTILPEYEQLMGEEGVHKMSFLPFKDKDTLAKYYEAADVFVLPTREDIWGLVINEAMAKGLPVLTTDACVAGMEMLPHKENSVVPTENVNALAEKLGEILTNEALRRTLEKDNLEAVRNYTIEAMAKTHSHIIKNIIEKRVKRVLFVGTQVPNELEVKSRWISAAGNRFQNNLIDNMKDNGYVVETIGFLGVNPGEEEKNRLLEGSFGPWTGVCVEDGINGKLRAVLHFRRMLKKRLYDNDYVVCYNILYAWLSLPIWAKRCKCKSVAVIADYSGPECYKNPVRKLYAGAMKRCFRRFDTVVGLSENIQDLLRRRQRFLLMEGGIDRRLYAFFRDRTDPDHLVYTVLYAGLLEKVTGIDLLLEAVKKLPPSIPLQIIFTGKGSMEYELKKAAEEDSRILYKGHLPYDEYLKVIKEADVLINPRNMNLPENQNNFPSKILEYLCSGKPVISTRFIGWEKFPHFLYCDSNPNKLAEAILQGRELIEHRAELFEKSRKMAESFLWEKQIQKMLN